DCGRRHCGEPASFAVPALRPTWSMVPLQYGLKIDGGTPRGGIVELVVGRGARVVVVVGGGSGAGAVGSVASGSGASGATSAGAGAAVAGRRQMSCALLTQPVSPLAFVT